MKHVWTTLSILLAAGVLTTGQSPAGGTAPPAKGKPLIEDYAQMLVTPPPASLALDPFDKKYSDAFGVPIVSSEKVPAAALLVARAGRVSVMAQTEMQTDPPEYRDMKKPALTDRRLTPRERENYDKPGGIGGMTDREYWNRRARGMGGNVTSCAEENVLGYPDTRYYGEHILVHEFSHSVHGALRTADPALHQEIQDAYTAAKEKGLFKGHYAENTVAEYFAEGSQWWFWSNYEWFDGTTRLQTPDDLKAYDPRLYAILERVYPGHHIPADIYHGRNIKPAPRRQ